MLMFPSTVNLVKGMGRYKLLLSINQFKINQMRLLIKSDKTISRSGI